MKLTRSTPSPNERMDLQLPKAVNSLRKYVNFEGTLIRSTPLYMMRLHPWSFPPSKRKRQRLVHLLLPSDCNDVKQTGG